MTSPPPLVPSPIQTVEFTDSLKALTLPSQRTALATPGW